MSGRAKSISARDLRYGRRGGRWLPMMTDDEQRAAFAAAVEAGEIVYGACFCTYWWLIRIDVGSTCGHCGEPRLAVAS